MITKRYIVKGIVQGVSFRATTRQQAQRLGVKGWVRNKADGSVEVRATADPETLAELETWLRQGPRGARVESLEALETVTESFDGFDITY